MMTLEQFIYYKQFAFSVFNYLNGKINKNIYCSLEVDYADEINNTLANLKRPNIVYLHLDNIITQCGNGYNKNAVSSLIIEAITHELFHVEQLMSQEKYRNDKQYANDIEDVTNYAAYKFLMNHMSEINKTFGILLDLSYLQKEFAHMKEGNYYQYCNVEEMYKSTIMNVIFRQDKQFYKFSNEVLDKNENIIIAFENGYNCLIKSNGVYDNLALRGFVEAVGAMASIFDCYTLNVASRTDSNRDSDVIIVTFSLSNGVIYPYYTYNGMNNGGGVPLFSPTRFI